MDGFHGPAGVEQRCAEVVMPRGVIGLGLQHCFKLCDGLGYPIRLQEGVAEVRMGVEVAGIQPQRQEVLFDRFRHPFRLEESVAELVARLAEMAPTYNRTVATPAQAREILGLRKH